MNQWISLAEQKPEPGQLVAINFSANWQRLRLCYYDSKATWCERNDREWEDDFREGMAPWFTEAEDADDWWDADVVAYWAPITPLPPERGAQ